MIRLVLPGCGCVGYYSLAIKSMLNAEDADKYNAMNTGEYVERLARQGTGDRTQVRLEGLHLLRVTLSPPSSIIK